MTNEPLSTAEIADRTSGGRGSGAANGDGAMSSSRGGTPEATVERTPLIGEDRGRSLLERWTEIQSGFVDSPRQSVEQADTLVAEVIQDLARSFAEERSNLEQRWDSGSDVETEDLRVALQRYRSFFQRLLAA